MNQLVPQNNQQLARPAAHRQRLHDLGHQIASGNAGPSDLVSIAERAAQTVKDQDQSLGCAADLRHKVLPAIEAALQKHEAYLREMRLLAAPATPQDITREITEMLLALGFRYGVDRDVFTQCAIEAVAREKPSLAKLVVARDRLTLRCECPSIAKIVAAFSYYTSDADDFCVVQTLKSISEMVALAGNHARLLEMLPRLEAEEARVLAEREKAERECGEQERFIILPTNKGYRVFDRERRCHCGPTGSWEEANEFREMRERRLEKYGEYAGTWPG